MNEFTFLYNYKVQTGYCEKVHIYGRKMLKGIATVNISIAHFCYDCENHIPDIIYTACSNELKNYVSTRSNMVIHSFFAEV